MGSLKLRFSVVETIYGQVRGVRASVNPLWEDTDTVKASFPN